MSITYGFFNSVDGDRTYNADQMSTYFEGLISNGVYENIGGALQVKASNGLTVTVQTGRAIIDSKWIRLDAIEPLTLNGAHVTLNRYTAIVLRLDKSKRSIELIMKDGDNATTPTKPAMVNDVVVNEICLAYIYVAAGAISITQANIIDTRADNNVCGWVTGIIKQVDTSELFLQWQTAYEEYFADMQAWKAEQKILFDNWFASLTETLQINTRVHKYSKVVETVDNHAVFPLDMDGYVYDERDILFVNVNGVMMTEVYDYLIDTRVTPVEMHVNRNMDPDNIVEIIALKSGQL